MRDGWGAWLEEEEGQIMIEGIWSDSGKVCRVSLVGECGGKGAARESVIMGFIFMCLPELFIEPFHD